MSSFRKFLNGLGVVFLIALFGIGIYSLFFDNNANTDNVATHSSETELINEKENSNKCQDENLAKQAFLDGCSAATTLGFGSGKWDLKEQWCKCIEANYNVLKYIDKTCKAPSNIGLYMAHWKSSGAVATCGTPNEPK